MGVKSVFERGRMGDTFRELTKDLDTCLEERQGCEDCPLAARVLPTDMSILARPATVCGILLDIGLYLLDKKGKKVDNK